jgi:DNA-binding response OmpR family regulator
VRVALIDDDLEYLDLVGEILAEQGWELIVCSRAADAIDCVRQEQPDVILLDLWLDEGRNGWEVLDGLIGDPATSSIPIIICSAVENELRTHEEWLAERGIRMLPKPFDLDEFYSVLGSAARVH